MMRNSFGLLNSRRTFQFSSAPGPKEGYMIGGAQTRGMTAFNPFLADLRFGINAIQMDNYITYGLNCEKAHLQDPHRFLKILDEKMNDFYALEQ